MSVIKLTNRIKVMERKPMTFMERLYFPAILKGMSITISHFLQKGHHPISGTKAPNERCVSWTTYSKAR